MILSTKRATTATLAILLIQAVAGCGRDPATDTQAFQVGDSAGVTIYDNSAGEWTEATGWTLSSEPIRDPIRRDGVANW